MFKHFKLKFQIKKSLNACFKSGTLFQISIFIDASSYYLLLNSYFMYLKFGTKLFIKRHKHTKKVFRKILPLRSKHCSQWRVLSIVYGEEATGQKRSVCNNHKSIDPEGLKFGNWVLIMPPKYTKKIMKTLLGRGLRPRQSFCENHKISGFKSLEIFKFKKLV